MLNNKLRVCDQCHQPVGHIDLGARDFPFWNGAFPRGISPSNIDGIVQDNCYAISDQLGTRRYPYSRFLVAETKHAGEELRDGQRMLLAAAAKIPGFTVLLIRDRLDGLYDVTNFATDSMVTTNDANLNSWARCWFADDDGVQELPAPVQLPQCEYCGESTHLRNVCPYVVTA